MHRRAIFRALAHSAAFLFVFLTLSLSTNDAESYEWKQTCERHNANGQKCERDETPSPLSWKRGCVTFSVDGDDANERRAALTAVGRSFATWSSVSCSAMTVNFDARADTDNTVRFRNADWEHSRTSFAVTAVSYQRSDGEILSAKIEINEEHYDHEALDSGSSGDAADLQNTVTHEIGHALGFAHSDVSAATMFGGAQLGETSKRTLHTDDVEGLCATYSQASVADICEDGESDEHEQAEEAKADEPGEPTVGWGENGPGAEPDHSSSEPACSVTAGSRSVKLPFASLLLFIALSLMLRHAASTGANRARRHPPSADHEPDRG